MGFASDGGKKKWDGKEKDKCAFRTLWGGKGSQRRKMRWECLVVDVFIVRNDHGRFWRTGFLSLLLFRTDRFLSAYPVTTLQKPTKEKINLFPLLN